MHIKDEFQSVLRNLGCNVYVSPHEGMFTSKTKNSVTNLPFSSLLTPDILAEQIITSRGTLTLFQTDVSAHREFLNETNRNGGLKNFMYAVTEV